MPTATKLSQAANSVWAKTRRDESSRVEASLPLWRHLDDAAGAAGVLWDSWVPPSTRGLIAASLCGDQDLARQLLVWLAGVHDIGKATPAFAVQVPDLAHPMRRVGLDMPGNFDPRQRRLLPHALAGHLIVVRWLTETAGWSTRLAHPLAVIVGGHHGVPPDYSQLAEARLHPELMGSGLWLSVQQELMDRQGDGHGIRATLQAKPDWKLSQPSQVLLTALVILADWIASNDSLFPYELRERVEGRLERAWAALDLPPPWEAQLPEDDADALMVQRFGIIGGARPVQRAALQLAAAVRTPGLIVIEAPMGEGKTEAALMAAEVLAARTGAGGCFVALPTQATTDAMFQRVEAWAKVLPTRRSDVRWSIFLAHGKASLNDRFRGLMARGHASSVAVDETTQSRYEGPRGADKRAELIAHEWLLGRKKGALSSFVVGTIDQVLFAALKSRYLALRHLALAQKVVIIDEVHAYDVYMDSYLTRTLEWLGAYGVPTILLSATLPSAKRMEMIKAYRTGASTAVGAPGHADQRSEDTSNEIRAETGYPVLTATSGNSAPDVRVTEPSGRRTEIVLERLGDELGDLSRRLEALLVKGGCALVVRNTVRRVQETVEHLRSRFPDTPVIAAHARYIAADRAVNDQGLLAKFGPRRPGDVPGSRPPRCIVVGSQVVEQSLDIDFDVLITDLAPADLMLQRMGRLHRHQRGGEQTERPGPLRSARCIVTGVDWTTTPPEPVRGSKVVYREFALLRSVAVFESRLSQSAPVVLPDAIAPLVEAAYGDAAVGPPEWVDRIETAREAHLREANLKREQAQSFQLLGVGRAGKPLIDWVQAGVGDADEGSQGEAQVRDGRQTLEVLVVSRTSDGAVTLPRWLDKGAGEVLSTELEIEPAQARRIAACALRLPLEMCAPGRIDAVLTDLERNWFDAWQRSPLLKDQLVLVLDSHNKAHVGGFDLQYGRDMGLEVSRP